MAHEQMNWISVSLGGKCNPVLIHAVVSVHFVLVKKCSSRQKLLVIPKVY